MANLATRLRFTQPQPDLDDVPGLKRLSCPSIRYDDDFDDYYEPFDSDVFTDWAWDDYGYDEDYFQTPSTIDERYYESPWSYSDFDFTWGDYGLSINDNSCVHVGFRESCVGCDLDDFISATEVVEDEVGPLFGTAAADARAAVKNRRERRRMSTIRHHRRKETAAFNCGRITSNFTGKAWHIHARKIKEPIDAFVSKERKSREARELRWELEAAAEDLLAA